MSTSPALGSLIITRHNRPGYFSLGDHYCMALHGGSNWAPTSLDHLSTIGRRARGLALRSWWVSNSRVL